MADRRTQRIREQLRQQPNPRAGRSSASSSLLDQMHRTYSSGPASAPTSPHTQLAQRFERRAKTKR